MARLVITVADGWVKVSEGALQFQKHNVKINSGSLAITHSEDLPTSDPLDGFINSDSGIRFSYGSIPAYIHAIDKDQIVNVMDIS